MSLLFPLESWKLCPLGKHLFLLFAQSSLTLCDCMDCSTPGFPVLHYLPELLKLMSIESMMSSNHLILGCPLLLLPSIFPSSRVFTSESALCVRLIKHLYLYLIHIYASVSMPPFAFLSIASLWKMLCERVMLGIKLPKKIYWQRSYLISKFHFLS